MTQLSQNEILSLKGLAYLSQSFSAYTSMGLPPGKAWERALSDYANKQFNDKLREIRDVRENL